jgi:IstB-like ATP binding protein
MGYLPLERQLANLLFALVSRRYERGSIIITSNRGFEQWGEILGDAMVAAALIDRLVHHATMITLKGKSYRLRERGLDVAPASPNRTRIASERQRSAKPTPQEGRSRPRAPSPTSDPAASGALFDCANWLRLTEEVLPRLGAVLTTNSPQGPHNEGLDERKRLVQAMELAGLEPATSWVRFQLTKGLLPASPHFADVHFSVTPLRAASVSDSCHLASNRRGRGSDGRLTHISTPSKYACPSVKRSRKCTSFRSRKVHHSGPGRR